MLLTDVSAVVAQLLGVPRKYQSAWQRLLASSAPAATSLSGIFIKTSGV
ncbi:hypothetical protein [Cellvibrio fibrivorans]|uniref:Uncharacterized protein n=1 Tax=Cellvibrio fibrivorans TaxID=126350 RepID=A0ABU1UUT6_9GAMM|nr:hypothetical protein [Cellvibrio fibrivorans]MDR7088888.1 hypothetical protein [Cellvibrio fibrivorans]